MIKRVVILAAFLALSACGPRPVYFRDEKIASTSCDGVKWFLWGVERPPNGFREQVRRCLPVGGSIQVAESLANHSGATANQSIHDLAHYLVMHLHLTSGGREAYLQAVEGASGAEVNYTQVAKMCGDAAEMAKRCGSAGYFGSETSESASNPDLDHISTSRAARSDLTTRIRKHRITRPTNGFSKEVENHGDAMALHLIAYVVVRLLGSLHCTPATGAGVSQHAWEIGVIATVMGEWEM